MHTKILLIHVITVAYNAHEVEYIWKKPADSSVGYEGKLQLSQFDIKQTEFRGLNFSRGNNMGTYSVIYSNSIYKYILGIQIRNMKMGFNFYCTWRCAKITAKMEYFLHNIIWGD